MVAVGRTLAGRPREGYNLVALMVMIAVINIAVAASLPTWSKIIQREKEQELIFRGLQYAEAIRVFQKRVGRFPTRLEELVEIEPRSIRQLWLDPLNDEPEWGLVIAGAAGANPGTGGNIAGGQLGTGNRGRQGDQGQRQRRRLGQRNRPGATVSPRQRIDDRRGGGSLVPRAGQQVTLGPIIGVHSLSEEDSAISFLGGNKHKEWQFTVELIPGLAAPAAADVMPRLHSNWIGKAFPEGVEPNLDGGLPSSGLDDEADPTAPQNPADRSRNRRRRRSGN